MIEQVRTSIGRGIELSGGHQHSRGIFTLTPLPNSNQFGHDCTDILRYDLRYGQPWSKSSSQLKT